MPASAWMGVFLLILAGGLFFFTLYWPRRRWRSSSTYQKVSSELDRSQAEDIYQNLNALYFKLLDVSREIQAKLDSKIHLLHALLKEADEKIRILETHKAEGHPKNLPQGISHPAPDQEKQIGKENLLCPTDEKKSPSFQRGKTSQTPPFLPQEVVPPLKEKVYGLYDQRVPSEEIARQLNLTLDQIHLIMNLRRYDEEPGKTNQNGEGRC